MAYMTVGRNHTKPFRMNLNGKRVSEPKASRKGVAASYHSLKDLGSYSEQDLEKTGIKVQELLEETGALESGNKRPPPRESIHYCSWCGDLGHLVHCTTEACPVVLCIQTEGDNGCLKRHSFLSKRDMREGRVQPPPMNKIQQDFKCPNCYYEIEQRAAEDTVIPVPNYTYQDRISLPLGRSQNTPPLILVYLSQYGDVSDFQETLLLMFKLEYKNQPENLFIKKIAMRTSANIGRRYHADTLTWLELASSTAKVNFLCVVDAHCDEESGFIINAGTETAPLGSDITEVLYGYLGSPLLKRVAAMCTIRGLAIMSCGQSVTAKSAVERMRTMVFGNQFTFITGFDHPAVVPSHIAYPYTDIMKSIYIQGITPRLAIPQSLCRRDLFQTGFVLFTQDFGQRVFPMACVIDTGRLPFGLSTPECRNPSCDGPHNVVGHSQRVTNQDKANLATLQDPDLLNLLQPIEAIMQGSNKASGDGAYYQCKHCRWKTKKILRPGYVLPADFGHRVYWVPHPGRAAPMLQFYPPDFKGR